MVETVRTPGMEVSVVSVGKDVPVRMWMKPPVVPPAGGPVSMLTPSATVIVPVPPLLF